MSFFGNKISYDDIADKFGISNYQAEELDMLDGKKDNKFDGKSLFDAIEEYNAQYENDNEIKIFYQTFFDFCKNKLKKLANEKHLQEKTEAKQITEDLAYEIFKPGFAKLDKPIGKINSNNVVEVLNEYKRLSAKLNLKIDNETLIEAILDESISDDKKKEYINHIKDSLIERLRSLSGDVTEVEQLFSKAVDVTLEKHWPLQNSETLDVLINEFIQIISQMEEIKKSNNNKKESLSTILASFSAVAAEGYDDILKSRGLDNDVYGNGYFDNKALQTSGSCWIHAGINNTLQSSKGRQYINNLVYKNKYDGSITVYLPGAAENGCPKPNGDGMYTYTKSDLQDAFNDSSFGDGDYTAFVLAIQDYRKEHKDEFREAGNFQEFCRIIYGSNNVLTADINSCSSDSKNLNRLSLSFLRQEVNSYEHGFMTKRYNDVDQYYQKLKKKLELSEISEISDTKERYSKIRELFNDNEYILYAGIDGDSGYEFVSGKYENDRDFRTLSNHAYTILDMQENKVILEESNNPGVPITYSIEDFMNTFDVAVAELP